MEMDGQKLDWMGKWMDTNKSGRVNGNGWAEIRVER